MIAPTPDGQLVLVTDLGTDQVLVYRLNTESGQLVQNDQGTSVLAAEPGSGPRHFAFSPNGHRLYVINELASTASVYAYDTERQEFQFLHLQTVSTLPAGFTGENACAHIAVSPDGRFVYGSNRGHDSIVIWAVDDERGELRLVGHEATRGQTPRNFAIDPTGEWLLVANQDSDSIVPFRRDRQAGTLSMGASITHTPSPVAIIFARE
jgi:6-phosphogluconolactonase